MLRIVVTAALALAPQSAGACPAELGGGIVVSASDGGTARITATETPGVFRERVTFDNVPGYAMLSHYGIYALATVDFDGTDEYPDSGETVAYGAPPPAPEPGQRIEGLIGVVDRVGLPMMRRHDLTAGPLGEVVIGGCSYAGFPLSLAIEDDDGPRELSLVFVTALGLALFTGYRDAEGAESYELLSIAPLTEAAP
jgi:hypothetical protein